MTSLRGSNVILAKRVLDVAEKSSSTPNPKLDWFVAVTVTMEMFKPWTWTLYLFPPILVLDRFAFILEPTCAPGFEHR